ncbi:unnamed protein product [Calypogeia fissa]
MKYKSTAKKVKPVALPLPKDSDKKMEQVGEQPSLRDLNKIGHIFDEETLEGLKIGGDGFLTLEEFDCFKEMLANHGKAFAFKSSEIGCVDPSVVAPMIIFIVPDVSWNLQPIPVPRALLPKLMELLDERIKMRILEPSCSPYSNRWFTVPKKLGALRFIQDLQPINKVTIRNMGIGPIVDEFTEAFARRAVYSMEISIQGMINFK